MKRLLLSLLCGCAARQSTAGTFDRHAMLSDISALALANYADLTATTTALAASAQSDDAAAVQAKWLAAYDVYKRCEAHNFGPATDDGIAKSMAFWPADSAASLDSEAAMNVALDSVGVQGKGFAALEYFVFDARFADRRAFAVKLAQAIAADAKRLNDAWTTGGHAAAFTDGLPPYRSEKGAIDVAYNHLLTALESAANMRLATPLGRKSGGTPQPDQVEARFSGKSVHALTSTFAGIERLYAGANEQLGLGALVKARDAALHDRVTQALADVKTALAALRDPLASYLTTDAAAIGTAADRMRDLRDLLVTEVAVAVGITVTFSDNDGD